MTTSHTTPAEQPTEPTESKPMRIVPVLPELTHLDALILPGHFTPCVHIQAAWEIRSHDWDLDALISRYEGMWHAIFGHQYVALWIDFLGATVALAHQDPDTWGNHPLVVPAKEYRRSDSSRQAALRTVAAPCQIPTPWSPDDLEEAELYVKNGYYKWRYQFVAVTTEAEAQHAFDNAEEPPLATDW